MKYLIADRVIYDPESGMLTIKEDELLVGKKLTNTANRILSLFITSPGEVLSRQVLLEKVWESAGHASSTSSLSQYISILRKILTSLTDIEETIIVVPKVGFYFSNDITIEAYYPLPVYDAVELAEEPEARPTRKYNKVYIFLLAMIVALVIANLFMIEPVKSDSRYSTLYNIETYHRCEIKTFEALPADLRSGALKIILLFRPELTEKCQTQQAIVMVQIQRSVFYGKRGRVFYSFCPVDKESNDITYCDNHYAFNWEV